ncbi:Cys-rich RiPP precursor [Clostridium perfringens]|nr:Cys-rich RiPP precursor [Clostridium perfringens]PWX52777.1 Cys-rich RiPP precursor [Clostridium perfringens]PWX69089.1 Cys-rich RiPP precursor [Clostridium perfringens]
MTLTLKGGEIMKHLFSKNSSKVNKDVQGYMCLDCSGCCINGCANLCTSCSNFCSWLVVMN